MKGLIFPSSIFLSDPVFSLAYLKASQICGSDRKMQDRKMEEGKGKAYFPVRYWDSPIPEAHTVTLVTPSTAHVNPSEISGLAFRSAWHAVWLAEQ